MWMILIVLVLLLGGVTFYTSHRLHRWLRGWWPRLPFAVVLGALGAMTVVMTLGFLGICLRTVAAYWMAVFVYLFLYTLLGDIIGGLLRLCRFKWCKGALYRGVTAVTVATLTAVTVLGGALHAHRIQHVSYEVAVARAADVSDIHILLLSDLHLGAVGSEERLATIVEQINSQKPDVVCIAGDFFDTDFASIEDPQAARDTLRELKATYGVYACPGNHDAGSTARQMTAFLQDCGIRLLADEYTLIDDRLYLVGRRDASPIGSFDGQSRQPLADFFSPADPTLPVVVMDHNPMHLDEYTEGVDLILSGHTHQGQLFPANLVTDGLYAVDYGYYRRDAHSPAMIVTSGVGYWGMPIRVGTDSELVSIRLT